MSKEKKQQVLSLTEFTSSTLSDKGGRSRDEITDTLLLVDGVPCMRQDLPPYKGQPHRAYDYAFGIMKVHTGLHPNGFVLTGVIPEEDAQEYGDLIEIIPEHPRSTRTDGLVQVVAVGGILPGLLEAWAIHHFGGRTQSQVDEIVKQVIGQMILCQDSETPVGREVFAARQRFDLRAIDWKGPKGQRVGCEWWLKLRTKDEEAQESGHIPLSPWDRRRGSVRRRTWLDGNEDS